MYRPYRDGSEPALSEAEGTRPDRGEAAARFARCELRHYVSTLCHGFDHGPGRVRDPPLREQRRAIVPGPAAFFPWRPSATAKSPLRGGPARRVRLRWKANPSGPEEILLLPPRGQRPDSETG